jgi:hypothetical protein
MKYNSIEIESIQLKVITEAIDEMVNHDVINFPKRNAEVMVGFSSYSHKKVFNILLVDFLSNLDKDLFNSSSSCLKALREICENPCFNIENSISDLETSVYSLKDWLEEEITVKTWFSSIDLSIDLKIQRVDFIKICGNTCKHSLGRLTKTASDLRKIFHKNGKDVSEEQSLLALEDFYERFHADILSYHASYLCEMINNIRWGIHIYLLPEFHRSHTRVEGEEGRYKYQVPDSIKSQFTKNCYWELMNEVRRKPFVQPFTADKHLKIEY